MKFDTTKISNFMKEHPEAMILCGTVAMCAANAMVVKMASSNFIGDIKNRYHCDIIEDYPYEIDDYRFYQYSKVEERKERARKQRMKRLMDETYIKTESIVEAYNDYKLTLEWD